MKKFTLFLASALTAVSSFAEAINVRVAPKAVPQAKHMTVKQQMDNLRSIEAHKSIDSKSTVALSDVKYNLRTQIGKAPASKPAAQAADVQTPVTPPAGLETETYLCTAVSYFDMGNVSYNVEVGYDGNDVYVQGILRSLPTGWIKGTLADGAVTFEQGQYMGEAEVKDYYTGESLGFFPATMMYQDGTTGADADLVLTYNAETGVLDDLAQGALYFDDGDGGNLDVLIGTRLTPASVFGEVSYDLVTPPASAQQSSVSISSMSFARNAQLDILGYMAVDGDDIYVAGLMNDMPGAWVKGTKDANGVVTFPKGQYIGMYAGQIDMWFMGIDPTDPNSALIDVLAQWNEEEQTLTFSESTWLIENADPISLYYADVFYNVTVSPAGDDLSVVVPPAGLETRLHDAKVISLAQYPYASGTYPVSIGFDGEDAYMQGLFYYAPNAWLKGTRNADGSITFASNQYLGKVQGFDIYVVACDDDEVVLEDYTFTYDAGNDTYYYNEYNTNISFSIAPNTTDAVDIIYNVELSGPDALKINTNVIWEQPEGELKVYSRAGQSYMVFFGFLINDTQAGSTMRIVTNGNDVYMENPIYAAPVEGGTWIKGTIEGNKIHMPLRQCTLYSEEDGYGYMTGIFHMEPEYDEDSQEYMVNWVMTDDREITFTIDEATGTITMDLESQVDPQLGIVDYIYGLAYTFDGSWAEYGDYNTVYTPFDGTPAVLPAGVETKSWAMMFYDGQYNSTKFVNIGVAGDKMYVEGLSDADPTAVIEGTIADGKVTFVSDQYLGFYNEHLAYATFANYHVEQLYDEVYDFYYDHFVFEYLPECTFLYDTENQILSLADSGIALVINGGKGAGEINSLTNYMDPVFSLFEEVAAKPANPIIYELTTDWYEDYGYDIFSGDILLKDVNGKYIDKDKTYYILWVKVNGEAKEFTFTSDEYTGLQDALGVDEIVELPYSAVVYDESDYEDITEGASYMVLYQTGFEDYGLQTVYYGGGERNTSDIVWLSGELTGIHDLTSDRKAAATFLYNLFGQRVNASAKGLVIRNDKKVLVK